MATLMMTISLLLQVLIGVSSSNEVNSTAKSNSSRTHTLRRALISREMDVSDYDTYYYYLNNYRGDDIDEQDFNYIDLSYANLDGIFDQWLDDNLWDNIAEITTSNDHVILKKCIDEDGVNDVLCACQSTDFYQNKNLYYCSSSKYNQYNDYMEYYHDEEEGGKLDWLKKQYNKLKKKIDDSSSSDSYDDDSHECSLDDWKNKQSYYENTKCPQDIDKDILSITRPYVAMALPNFEAMMSGERGGDLNFVHYGGRWYPQWLIGYYEEINVLLIYFQASEGYRIPDIKACLDITHQEFSFGNKGNKIRVAGGIASVIDKGASKMHHVLLKDLEYIFKEYKIEGEKKKNMRLVINGVSLGGGYAVWWYLGLYGNTGNEVGKSRNDFVGKYFPDNSELDKVTIITVGAPLIVYHKDIDKISKKLKDRIFHIIIGLDPVPMLTGGTNGLQKRDKKTNMADIWSNWGWYKFIKDHKYRLLAASNAPIGNFYLLSYAYKENKKVNIFQKLDENAITAHLSNGGQCLFGKEHLYKSVGDIGKLFADYHGKRYFPMMDKSGCIDKINIEKRKTFEIKYCKPRKTVNRWGKKKKKVVSFHECYTYNQKNTKSKDFIDEKECKCYDVGGKFKQFLAGF